MHSKNFFKHSNVQKGTDCEVSGFCSLENVILGDSVSIGDGVQLKNVVVGNGTKIGVNARLYSPDQNQPIEIGNQCWISYGVFSEATGGKIILEDYAVVAHNTIMLTSSGPGKKNAIMDALYPEQQGDIRIGTHSWIGTQCTILPNAFLAEGVVLGAHAFAAGGEYEAWTVYGGVPAKILKKIDPEKVTQAKNKMI